MTNYTKATDFAAKDALLTGNPSKLVKGTEINTEFAAIETAVATKADASSASAFTAGATTVTTLTTSGQIIFPAVQNPSANANTMDDYEEGTWTPSVGGTATYTNQYGFYTKKGNEVTVVGKMTINVIGTGSTTSISGLPFTSGNVNAQYYPGVVSYFSGVATNMVAIQCQNQATASNVIFTGLAASGASNGNSITIFASGTAVHFTITYFV